MLSSIAIALQHATGTNDAHLFLSDGVPGQAGANILESFTLTNLPASTGSNPIFDTLTSTLHPLLTAGQTYYFYQAETGDEFNSWHLNSIGGIGTVISSNDNVNYDVDDNVQAAFRVSVASSVSVPEPSGMVLLAAAGSLAGCGLRRRRNAARRAD